MILPKQQIVTADLQKQLLLDSPEPTYYLPQERWGFFSVLIKKPGAKHYQGQQRSYPLNVLPEQIKYWTDYGNRYGYDVYITQATFNRRNRRKANFQSVGQIFVDLDIYNSIYPNLRQADPKVVLEFVYERCDDIKLYYPSIVLFSGKGMYLKWLHENLPSRVLPKWEYLQQYVNAAFEDFGADSNAKDASRILRLERTINHKTGELAQVIDVNYEGFEVAQYTFQELCDKLLPYSEDECKVFKLQMQELKAKITQRKRAQTLANKKPGIVLDSKKAFHAKRLNWSRYKDILSVAEMRYGAKGCPDGFRDPFIWTACNYFALSNYLRRDLDMWHEFYQITVKLAPHWTQAKIRSALSTIYSKYKEAVDGRTVEFAGKEYPPLYTHKSTNLINLLQITPEEQKKLLTLIEKDEKLNRHRNRMEQQRREAGVKQRAEYDKSRADAKAQKITEARKLREQGLSLRAIALRMNTTAKTVHGWLK